MTCGKDNDRLFHCYNLGMKYHKLWDELFGSDAYHIPEFFWLAAMWGRLFLSQALGVCVDAKLLTRDEAITAARQFLHKIIDGYIKYKKVPKNTRLDLV
ncbi:MAG: hypothetical protein HN915_01875 [Candidatus Marinimicrobia bacterium]|jgi:uncharacterized protein|nr:hypothetical protein [Candidatus Neomarinimicrobiota bacterium]MBT3675229.1 hypothetical protein [Candidatus Neomarinimicrobiota bacterium]MBT6129483.1 hypothetical protein [Candidatus Neomarinimicrobiota bacterium]MBT6637761.1 hypothetical protein [Candidatus Neomarinimicrobiota bacterium]MBT7194135.1 hypothetical protein [Candidatus Neomarinimicrobiota bacterium]